MHYVHVKPLAPGWQVESALNPGPMVFRNGAAAEREGARHAALLAGKGDSVTLVIADRSGAIVGVRLLGLGPRRGAAASAT